MSQSNKRLYFLDAIRAFAIVMMLQGHFVYALLDNTFRNPESIIYTTWEYFRGMTAPTFFTITGFVFTYLLIKQSLHGFKNPRVSKGIRRAVKLIACGYALRISLFAVFSGKINASFFYVDVLQCIGVSLILLIGLYLLFYKKNPLVFQFMVLAGGILFFILQPLFGSFSYTYLPVFMRNYLSMSQGSIFTIVPWFGYVCFGSFLSIIFYRYEHQPKFYPFIISMLLVSGVILMFGSSELLMILYHISEVSVFKTAAYNNYLFTRLGDISILFALFIGFRNHFKNRLILNIGANTLYIYNIHFFILYGSWFGIGLSAFFYRSLGPWQVVFGALIFVITICYIALIYANRKDVIIQKIHHVLISGLTHIRYILKSSIDLYPLIQQRIKIKIKSNKK